MSVILLRSMYVIDAYHRIFNKEMSSFNILSAIACSLRKASKLSIYDSVFKLMEAGMWEMLQYYGGWNMRLFTAVNI